MLITQGHVEAGVKFLDRFSVEIVVFFTIMSTCSISTLVITDSSRTNQDFDTITPTRYTTLDFTVIVVLKLLAATALFELYSRLRFTFGSLYPRMLAVLSILILSLFFFMAVATVRSFGFPLVNLDEAVVFFVLLMDRSFVIDLVRAFHPNEVDLQARLSRLLYRRGFEVVLDTTVCVLAIGVGLRSGSPTLVSVCSIVALSLFLHTLVSLTFFPAFVLLFRRIMPPSSVVMIIDSLCEEEEVVKDKGKGTPTLSNALCAKSVARIHKRMKMVIVIGLLVLHAYAYSCLSSRSFFLHSPKPAYTHSCLNNKQDCDQAKDLFQYCPHFENVIIVIYLMILFLRDIREEPQMNIESQRPQKQFRRVIDHKDAGVQVGYRCRYSHSQTCVSKQRKRTTSGDVVRFHFFITVCVQF